MHDWSFLTFTVQCTCVLVGVMIFVRSHFGGSAPRDVVSALHGEVVETHHQVRFFSLSTQQLSEAIQHLVKEHHMTWFQFAQYLLRSRTTCLFVF